jgi:hypothetical protein
LPRLYLPNLLGADTKAGRNAPRSQMSHDTFTNTIDRRLRRLLRDLTAVGLMEAGNNLTADERLTATLGPELHRAIRAEVDCPLPLRSSSRRVA